MYQSGKYGVEADAERGADFFRKAAVKEHAQAQVGRRARPPEAGPCVHVSRGGPVRVRIPRRARACALLTRGEGGGGLQFNLGWCWMEGEGLREKRSVKKALEWCAAPPALPISCFLFHQ